VLSAFATRRLSLLVGRERVLQHARCLRAPVATEHHGDDVEAHGDAPQPAGRQKLQRRPHDSPPLARIHGFQRTRFAGAPRLYLNERDSGAVAGDQVDLAPPRAIVAAQDLPALLLQQRSRRLFRGSAPPRGLTRTRHASYPSQGPTTPARWRRSRARPASAPRRPPRPPPTDSSTPARRAGPGNPAAPR